MGKICLAAACVVFCLTASASDGIVEYVEAQLVNGDRAFAHVNIGLLALSRGDAATAQAAYHQALRVEPRSIQASVNLADLYRLQERDAQGEVVLREVLVRGAGAGLLSVGRGTLEGVVLDVGREPLGRLKGVFELCPRSVEFLGPVPAEPLRLLPHCPLEER